MDRLATVATTIGGPILDGVFGGDFPIVEVDVQLRSLIRQKRL